ncbi:EamA family transporter [Tumebacillus sp. DT12]|uniref:EamA family transporter n=1 Tax=Tumebacillus lacus TaxID=2995335 RepID=A0ABT3X7U8_9BACL|nr:EamA family transporter [Tumebacillus lacus]MCX7572063.1 EamA family transporter [Tumebacillus lacus]
MSVRYKGYVMAITGASLWGISGVVAQTMFHQYGFATEWLVSARMFVSGLLFLLIAQFRAGQSVLHIWKQNESRQSLLLFSAVGMLGAQYTFFASIYAGNAATATLLQSLGPMVVMIYLAFRVRKIPSGREIIALLFACLGVYLLVTNGSMNRLSISAAAVFWGLLTAVCIAFNSIQPKRMLETWGSSAVIGWGMLIGSLLLAVITRPWTMTEQIIWTLPSVFSLCFVILLGTLVPFFLYIDSLRFISATEASLLSSIEPLVAVCASVMWLQSPMGLFEMGGAGFILLTVVLLSLQRPQPAK